MDDLIDRLKGSAKAEGQDRIFIHGEKECELFEKHKVLSKEELYARVDVLIETYSMTINIEAKTMLSMARRQILPAASAFAGQVASDVAAVAASDKIEAIGSALISVDLE